MNKDHEDYQDVCIIDIAMKELQSRYGFAKVF